jgi:hypothetical protein
MRVFHHAGLLVNGPPGTAGRVALQLVIRQLQLSRAGRQTSGTTLLHVFIVLLDTWKASKCLCRHTPLVGLPYRLAPHDLQGA